MVGEVIGMQIDGLIKKAYNVCDWIAKIVIVNILWLLFTLAGLIVLGIMPATIALFTVVRKWTVSESDIPIFATFLRTYKKEFLQANYLGLFLVAIGSFLLYDLRLVLSMEGNFLAVLGVPLMIMILCYLLILLYIIPVYVHFELKFLQYFKYAFFIGILNIPTTLLMVMLLLSFCMLLSFLPGFIPFFSVSVISIIIMFGATTTFQRIADKQQKYNVQN